jgi:serine/threonine protein kinase
MMGDKVANSNFDKWLLSQGHLGSWTLAHKLGNGAFGVVFKAEKNDINGQKRTAAIKVMSPKAFGDKELEAAFRHEFDVLSKIESPYVPAVLDSGVAVFNNGKDDLQLMWFAMEFITGGDLQDELNQHGALNEPDWLELAHDLLSACEAIHEKGIIHRDIKPGNIARFSRRTMLVDFGLASFVDTDDPGDEVAASTPAFGAPEQQDGTNPALLQYPVDIFAAGVTLAVAATQKLLWESPTKTEVSNFAKSNPQIAKQVGPQQLFHVAWLSKKMTEQPNLASLSNAQMLIVAQMIDIDPTKRGTASEHLASVNKLLPQGSSRKPSIAAGSSNSSKLRKEKSSRAAEKALGQVNSSNEYVPKSHSKQRSFITAWAFSVFLGLFAVDRFYLGKIWTAILKLLTFGGYGIWIIVDIVLLTFGKTQDKWGRELLEYDKHKKFVRVWTAPIVVGVFIVLNLISISSPSSS